MLGEPEAELKIYPARADSKFYFNCNNIFVTDPESHRFSEKLIPYFL